MKLRFQASKIIDEALYFSNRNFNGLYKLDLTTGTILFVDFFPNESILGRSLHSKCLMYKDTLIFLPGAGGKNIHFYNYITNHIDAVQIFERSGWEGDAIILENSLWVIPFVLKDNFPVIEIDLDTQAVWVKHDLWKKFSDINCVEKRNRFMKRIVLQGNTFWFAKCGTNQIYNMNLETTKVKCYETEISNMFGMFQGHNNFWITAYEDQYIYRWNPEEGLEGKYMMYGVSENELPSNHILEINGQTYAIPAFSDYFTKYNETTAVFEKVVRLPDEPISLVKDRMRFVKYDFFQNRLICFPENADSMPSIDLDSRTIDRYNLCVAEHTEQEPYRSINHELIKNGGPVVEDQYISLEALFKSIGKVTSLKKNIKANTCVGGEIYQNVNRNSDYN